MNYTKIKCDGVELLIPFALHQRLENVVVLAGLLEYTLIQYYNINHGQNTSYGEFIWTKGTYLGQDTMTFRMDFIMGELRHTSCTHWGKSEGYTSSITKELLTSINTLEDWL